MGQLMGLQSEAMIRKFNFEKNYIVIVPDREDWESGSLMTGIIYVACEQL